MKKAIDILVQLSQNIFYYSTASFLPSQHHRRPYVAYGYARLRFFDLTKNKLAFSFRYLGKAALFSMILIMTSCASVDKMIDNGNFDAAVIKSVRKMAGKKKLKQKHVLAIEDAFKKATERDMAQAKRLYHSVLVSDWAQVIRNYDRIIRRQNAVQPLLPITAKDGYKANFVFVKVDRLRSEAVAKYLTLAYTKASILMEEGRAGDKLAARSAYHAFGDLWRYSDQYRDAKQLQLEARDLGINHVRISLKNNMFLPVSPHLKQELLLRSFPDQKWTNYHLEMPASLHPDFEMVLTLQNLDISPERYSEQIFVESKEIEDGFEYILDERGNVMKDSLGNDIKQPLYVQIRAKVTKVHQFKSASLVGEVMIRNLENNLIERVPIRSEIVFDHTGATFRGDRRALTSESKDCLRSGPLPFPADEFMLADAVNGLERVIKNDVVDHFSI